MKLDIFSLFTIVVFVVFVLKFLKEKFGVGFDLFRWLKEDEEVGKIIEVALNLEDLKEMLDLLEDDDEIGLEAVASKFKLNSKQLLDMFNAKDLKGLKKKLGLKNWDYFDRLAEKLNSSKKTEFEKYIEEIAEAKEEYLKIDFEKLAKYMISGLFVLVPGHLNAYSKIGLLLHWFFWEGQREKFEKFKKYYFLELKDGDLPDELKEFVANFVPDVNSDGKKWFFDIPTRLKMLSNGSFFNKVLIEIVANFLKTYRNIEVNTNYNTFDEFFENEIKKIDWR